MFLCSLWWHCWLGGPMEAVGNSHVSTQGPVSTGSSSSGAGADGSSEFLLSTSLWFLSANLNFYTWPLLALHSSLMAELKIETAWASLVCSSGAGGVELEAEKGIISLNFQVRAWLGCPGLFYINSSLNQIDLLPTCSRWTLQRVLGCKVAFPLKFSVQSKVFSSQITALLICSTHFSL